MVREEAFVLDGAPVIEMVPSPAMVIVRVVDAANEGGGRCELFI